MFLCSRNDHAEGIPLSSDMFSLLHVPQLCGIVAFAIWLSILDPYPHRFLLEPDSSIELPRLRTARMGKPHLLLT